MSRSFLRIVRVKARVVERLCDRKHAREIAGGSRVGDSARTLVSYWRIGGDVNYFRVLELVQQNPWMVPFQFGAVCNWIRVYERAFEMF
jgi:hypothetical protein